MIWLIGILYILLFGASHLLHTKGVSSAVTRKITHVGGGILSFFLPLVTNRAIAIVIGLVAAAFLWTTQRKGWLQSVHCGRSADHGATFFPLGLVLAALFFWNEQFLPYQIGCLVVGLGDGLAGLVGTSIGKRRWGPAQKTIAGSTIFFLVTTLILGFFSVSWPLALVASLLLTILEGIIPNGWDNLVLPTAAAGLFQTVKSLF